VSAFIRLIFALLARSATQVYIVFTMLNSGFMRGILFSGFSEKQSRLRLCLLGNK